MPASGFIAVDTPQSLTDHTRPAASVSHSFDLLSLSHEPIGSVRARRYGLSLLNPLLGGAVGIRESGEVCMHGVQRDQIVL